MKRQDQALHPQQRLAGKIVRRNSAKGTAVTVAGALFWAISSTCGQYLMQKRGYPAEWLTCVRMTVTGILLTAFSIIKNRGTAAKLFKSKKDTLILLIYGIAGLMLGQFTFLKAVDASNAGTATVLQYLSPIIIIIAVCIKNMRPPKVTEAVSVVLAFTGVFMLATHADVHSLAMSKEGFLWGMMAALGMVLYSILPTRLVPKYGSIMTTGLGMLSGGIVLLFVVRPWQYRLPFDLPAAAAVFGVVIIGGAVGYTLYMQGVSDIGSVKANMIACIDPVSCTVLASVFLGNEFVWQDYLGIGLILITVFILSVPSKKLHVSFGSTPRKKTKSPSADPAENSNQGENDL